MGLLIEGKWHTDWYDTKSTKGRFERKESSFRNWVTVDGSAGVTGVSGFKAEPNRYHLYVSLACPWAHRTLIYRALKGLEESISVSVVNAFMGDSGWTFHSKKDSKKGPEKGLEKERRERSEDYIINDPIHNAEHLHQVYTAAMPDYTGRVTVPVLWDKKTHTIVSNESSEIIRMLNSAFDNVGALEGDYYPTELRAEIDTLNDFVYPNINNGVYRAGFATTKDAYEEAVIGLFDALDTVEQTLAKQRYLTGDRVTEADWRLFTTLIRFDAVYVGHFKCNLRRIVDYPNLWGYVKDLYQTPKVADTVCLTDIKAHYYGSHATINPTGIIPSGPVINFDEPHDRNRFQ